MADAGWVLSPSDFKFLWEECKRCFYLKVRENFPRPASPMPGIFVRIDQAMKDCFGGKRSEALLPELPPGRFDCRVGWVQSLPLALPGHSAECVIRGKPDTVIHFDDGSFGVIDFKTTRIKAEQIELYERQLHAYAWALEQAAPEQMHLAPVNRLGLAIYEPKEFSLSAEKQAVLSGPMAWKEIRRNDGGFRSFLSQALDVLERPAPPEALPGCTYCRYRERSRQNRY